MRSLHELLLQVPGITPAHLPAENIQITGLSADSRTVQPGYLFIAWQGKAADGHTYIPDALARGAAALLTEKPLPDPVPVPVITVPNARLAYSYLSSAWFGHPARRLTIVGITGTNGKSSTAYYLYQLWQKAGYRAGLIGTVFCKAADETLPATLTTPDSYVLHQLFADFVSRGITHVAMEVSSIALDQHRTAGVPFMGGIFTNLSHDHLDYHGTFTAYRGAKKRLFDDLPEKSFALTNIDDRNGIFMLQNTRACRYGYSRRQPADFHGTLIEGDVWGLSLRLRLSPLRGVPVAEEFPPVHVAILGDFQLENLLAAWGAAILVEAPGDAPSQWVELGRFYAQALSEVRGLPGRMETIPLPEGRVGIVDYAHTPDAVEKVLRVLRPLVPAGGQLVAVLGAGGNRDASKRPLMAKAAALHADVVWLTSDNPRYEDPHAILENMHQPLPPTLRRKILREVDRREAIRRAVTTATPHSLIAILGKGHETYQETQGVKYPFSDQEVLHQLRQESL
jgi:UDP-N-acetylmuramoyl-L-alanyl-D-glutamate--2,6-diaminopimelate ligase